ncbi:MAG: lipocalin-like domain-containing protein [Burkholderiales bacterium]|nr:lipocalin-like domain-containing protein [Burkholderiales bacterium]
MTSPLIGAWHLVRWETTYGDGRPAHYALGKDATGLIAYTPDGWMNASMARAGRAPLSSESARTAPEKERLAAFDSFFSYGGRYRIEGDHVIHSVTIAHNPNMVGTEQRRLMTFGADGTLTLSAEDTVPGSTVTRHHRLIWKRGS